MWLEKAKELRKQLKDEEERKRQEKEDLEINKKQLFGIEYPKLLAAIQEFEGQGLNTGNIITVTGDYSLREVNVCCTNSGGGKSLMAKFVMEVTDTLKINILCSNLKSWTGTNNVDDFMNQFVKWIADQLA